MLGLCFSYAKKIKITMNKLIKLLKISAISLSIAITIEAMEQSQEQVNWNNLPIELKSYILSLIPEVKSISNVIESYKYVIKTNKELRSLVKNLVYNQETLFNVVNKCIKFDPGILSKGLLNAVAIDDEKTVKVLLRCGANVNAKCKFNWSALMWAIYLKHKEIAKILLDAGADSNFANTDGQTALMLICDKYLIELLLEKGANINAQDKDGDTALMIAVRVGKKNIVELLISKGADVNIRNHFGQTALRFAQIKLTVNPDSVPLFKEIINILQNAH